MCWWDVKPYSINQPRTTKGNPHVSNKHSIKDEVYKQFVKQTWIFRQQIDHAVQHDRDSRNINGQTGDAGVKVVLPYLYEVVWGFGPLNIKD